MPAQRRFFPSGKPYIVSNRLSEGLPFVPNKYISAMLHGVIARACHLYPAVTMCSYIFLQNHYHMLLVLNGDPNALKDFMNYVDGEIAKLVSRWLGKRHVKIWAQRYFAAVLLDAEAAFEQQQYLFANPVEAYMVEKAEDWKGCSTFHVFGDDTPRQYKWVRPSFAPRLPNGKFDKRLVKSLVNQIEELDAPSYAMHIDPFAWMDCFEETKRQCKTKMKARLFGELARVAKRCAQERLKSKTSIAGTELLSQQNPHKYYKPKDFSRKVFCISTCSKLRCAFIDLYKIQCTRARRAWLASLVDFGELRVPLGMFAPPQPARGSILSFAFT